MLEILFILTLVSSGPDHFREFCGIMPDDSIALGSQYAGCWDDGFGPPPYGQGMNDPVYCIKVNGSDLWVGGLFNNAGGISANAIARWDGNSWWNLGTGLSGGVYPPEVRGVAVIGTDVYVGGAFWTAGGFAADNVARWDGNDWYSLGEGTAHYVLALAAAGTDLYVGGSFPVASGVPGTSRIARWDGASWHPLGSGMNGTVRAIAVDGSDVYAGGYFTEAGGVAANRIARWDGDSWMPLGSGFNSHVWAIAVSGSHVYAGGYFTEAGGVAVNHIAQWDGESWIPLGSGVNDIVTCISVAGDSIFVGGYFTQAGEVEANYIAMWDGSSWNSLGTGLNNAVHAIACRDSEVFAGGTFTEAGGYSSSHFARWTAWGEGVGESAPPERFEIHHVVPNPVSGQAVVSFSIPSVEQVCLEVFDLYGRLVSSHQIGEFSEGQHSCVWTGLDSRGNPLVPGVYTLRIRGEGHSASYRAVLL